LQRGVGITSGGDVRLVIRIQLRQRRLGIGQGLRGNDRILLGSDRRLLLRAFEPVAVCEDAGDGHDVNDQDHHQRAGDAEIGHISIHLRHGRGCRSSTDLLARNIREESAQGALLHRAAFHGETRELHGWVSAKVENDFTKDISTLFIAGELIE